MFSDTDIARFWSNVIIGQPNECWEWHGAKSSGYGEIHVQRTTITAHRMAYILAHGSIPPRALICHRCNNRPCVKPAHLYAGTSADNVHDTMNAGTNFIPPCHRGESNPTAKLTESNVLEIRHLYAAGGISQPQLARRFGVNQKLIWLIVHRKVWKHLP